MLPQWNFPRLKSLRLTNLLKRGLVLSLLLSLTVLLSLQGQNPAWAADRVSRLPSGNAITDGRALLRYSLPIDNPLIREVQTNLEDISNLIRGKRWSAISKNVSKAAAILRDRQADLIGSVPDHLKPQAEQLISEIQAEFEPLQTAVEQKNKPAVTEARSEVLKRVGDLEELMVTQFPYAVPDAYKHLPQLKGRATIAISTDKGDLTVVVDGYSAPVTAGNFVDLVQRGFYNGLKFTRAEESYVLQAGDPEGPDEGFIDPKTGEYRAIPLEVLVQGDQEPTYGITLEDAGRYRDQPVLPFSAFGAVALARPGDDPNGGSSQFFFFLFEPELTPAGLNLLDGRYSVFGYVVEGKDVLEKLKAGDKIVSAKVVKGLDKLVEPIA